MVIIKSSILFEIPRCLWKKEKKEKVRQTHLFTRLFGGELGIRTLGTLRTQHFECCTFDHSDNSPYMLTRFHEVNAIFNFY